jgi:hypothetical protein
MNARLFPLPLLVLTATSAYAGEPRLADITATPAANSPWRVGAGYAQFLGLKTKFSGLGTFNNPNTLQPLGSGINRNYDNGYVRLDSSGNLGGQTWNWSYNNSSQYNSAGSGSINQSITNSLANAGTDEDGSSKPGAEIFAYYDMGAAGFNGRGKQPATWGFRAGLQYSRVNEDNQDLLSSGLTTTTDSFSLGGTPAPAAPFVGNPSGPGPLLSDNPTRSTANGGSGLVSGNRELDVDLTLLNLGSYLEIPVTEKFDVLVEAGVSLGLADGSYSFRSSTTITNVGTQTSSGSDSSTDFLPGIYLGLGSTYKINDDWSILGSARYQYLQSYDLSASGSQASLSFNSAFVISLSAAYSF